MFAKSLFIKTAAASLGSVGLFTAGTTSYYYGLVPSKEYNLLNVEDSGPIIKTKGAKGPWRSVKKFHPSNLFLSCSGRGNSGDGICTRHLEGIKKLPNKETPKIFLFTDPSSVPEKNGWPIYKFTYKIVLEKNLNSSSYFGRCNPIQNSEGPRNSCATIFLPSG